MVRITLTYKFFENFIPDFPDCDFENNLCGWNVEAELNGTEFFIFIRTQGKLHEDGEAPTSDHTESDTGVVL